MKTTMQYFRFLLLLLFLNGSVSNASAQSGTTLLRDGTIKKADKNKLFKKARRLEDGTVIYPDGTVKRPDGTVKFPDGRVKKSNGSVHYPDGRVRFPRDNRKAEKWMPPGHAKKIYGEKSAKSFAPGQQKMENKK
ncbi:MAG: T-complex 10 C-terminal domain-containing protein [Segetibacter sp.]